MVTQGVSFRRPVNTPIYNVKRNIIEATLKENQGASKEVVAEAIFDALQSRGFIPCEAVFEDYKSKIIQVIKDRDNDGYYDVDIVELNEALGARFQSGGPNDPTDALQSHPLLETYYKDNVVISSSAKLPQVTSSSGNPALLNMSFSESLKYFRNTYSNGVWSEEKINQFVDDLKMFMESHFVSVPVETVEEAKDAVVDNLEVSDDLFAQMSKDGKGRVRIDCGIYAEIYRKIFESAGLQTEFAFVTMEVPGGVGGHLVALGKTKQKLIIGSNENISVLTYSGKKETEDKVASECLRQGLGKVLSVNLGESPSIAMNSANSKSGITIRYFNNPNITISQKWQEIRALISMTDKELQNLVAKKLPLGTNVKSLINSERQMIGEIINQSIADFEILNSMANENMVITFRGKEIFGRSGISAYVKNCKLVLSLVLRLINSPDRKLELSPQEISQLKAAKGYFSQFNNENGNYFMYTLAGILLSKLT